MVPSLCGSFLTDKRSLVAFTWTLTCVLTFLAFICSMSMVIHVHSHYSRMERYYQEQYEAAMNRDDDAAEGEEEHNNSADSREWEQYLALASLQSKSLTFVAVYTVILAAGLSFYGSTAIVGFTSLRGVYIGPCFSSSGSSTLKLGIFGGAIIFFANMLLMCAVVFGEIRVDDWREGGEEEREDREPYEIERIATVLAVTCMFLAALYSIFAVLLFLYYGNIESLEDDESLQSKPLSSIANDPRRENFLTMGDASQMMRS